MPFAASIILRMWLLRGRCAMNRNRLRCGRNTFLHHGIFDLQSVKIQATQIRLFIQQQHIFRLRFRFRIAIDFDHCIQNIPRGFAFGLQRQLGNAPRAMNNQHLIGFHRKPAALGQRIVGHYDIEMLVPQLLQRVFQDILRLQGEPDNDAVILLVGETLENIFRGNELDFRGRFTLLDLMLGSLGKSVIRDRGGHEDDL
jgi:hypothetical protein